MSETIIPKEGSELDIEAQIGVAIITEALGLSDSDFRVEVSRGQDDSVDVVVLPTAQAHDKLSA